MPIPPNMICDCRRCGHAWVKRIAGRPVRCPKCKEHDWDIPAGKLKMGRPPKKIALKKKAARA
jgi:Zn finger protein HypA/HybF involved in hydrogenase expression